MKRKCIALFIITIMFGIFSSAEEYGCYKINSSNPKHAVFPKINIKFELNNELGNPTGTYVVPNMEGTLTVPRGRKTVCDVDDNNIFRWACERFNINDSYPLIFNSDRDLVSVSISEIPIRPENKKIKNSNREKYEIPGTWMRNIAPGCSGYWDTLYVLINNFKSESDENLHLDYRSINASLYIGEQIVESAKKAGKKKPSISYDNLLSRTDKIFVDNLKLEKSGNGETTSYTGTIPIIKRHEFEVVPVFNKERIAYLKEETIKDFEKENGRKPTDAELNSIIDEHAGSSWYYYDVVVKNAKDTKIPIYRSDGGLHYYSIKDSPVIRINAGTVFDMQIESRRDINEDRLMECISNSRRTKKPITLVGELTNRETSGKHHYDFSVFTSKDCK